MVVSEVATADRGQGRKCEYDRQPSCQSERPMEGRFAGIMAPSQSVPSFSGGSSAVTQVSSSLLTATAEENGAGWPSATQRRARMAKGRDWLLQCRPDGARVWQKAPPLGYRNTLQQTSAETYSRCSRSPESSRQAPGSNSKSGASAVLRSVALRMSPSARVFVEALCGRSSA